MAKLEIDLDVLRQTINTYNMQIIELNSAKNAIIRSLDALKCSGWDSNAGNQWFSLLDNEWLENFSFQLRVLGQLKENLSIALEEYGKVYDLQQELGNCL